MKPILRSLINQSIRAKSILQTGRAFHATIALKGSKVIAIGYNNYTRLHPYARFGKYASYKTVNYNHVIGLHSEITCIKQILFRDDYHKITIVNLRIDNNNKVANAKPCVNCQRVLKQFNFKHIFYTDEQGQFKEFKTAVED